jgi:hypothetical protein
MNGAEVLGDLTQLKNRQTASSASGRAQSSRDRQARLLLSYYFTINQIGAARKGPRGFFAGAGAGRAAGR